MGHKKKIEECRWIIPLAFRQNYVDVFFKKRHIIVVGKSIFNNFISSAIFNINNKIFQF